MKSIHTIFYILIAGILSGCSAMSGNDNIDYNWPADIVGESFEFTVTEPGDSGIPAGNVIVYNYDANGSVGGINPVSNQRYTPDFYTYEPNDKSAVIYLEYYDGEAWEEYTLTPGESLEKGTYTYKGFTGIAERNASGTYEIVEPIVPESVFELVGQGTPILESTDLSGSVNDQRQFSVTVPSDADNVMFSVTGNHVGLSVAVPGSNDPFTGIATCEFNTTGKICFVDAPSPGTWTVTVVPNSSYSDVTFLAEKNLPELPGKLKIPAYLTR